MPKIICVGSVCKDIFFPTAEGKVIETPEDILSQKKLAFELGAKYKIEERHETLGGCAGNVAVGLARLGIESGCYGMVGDDETGGWIRQELERNGAGTDLIDVLEGGKSDLSAIVVDSASGDRVIFSNQKSNGELIVDEEKLSEAEWVFIGDLHGEWEDNLDRIIEASGGSDLRIAFNPRQSNIHDNPQKVLDAIPKAVILILNKDEAIELVSVLDPAAAKENLESEEFLIGKFLALGAGTVVLTDGERGGWANDGNGMIHVDAERVEAADSTGAGDACSSAFIAARIKGLGLEESLGWGVRNGASVVKHYGAIDGLMTEKEIS